MINLTEIALARVPHEPNKFTATENGLKWKRGTSLIEIMLEIKGLRFTWTLAKPTNQEISYKN